MPIKITRMPWWKKAVLPFKPGVYAFNTASANIRVNGELGLLRTLTRRHSKTAATPTQTKPFVCFDVGANTGEYSNEFIGACIAVGISPELHSFEPMKKSFQELEERMGSLKLSTINPTIILNNAALSDTTGTSTIYADFEGSSFASMYKRELPEIKFDTKEEIKLRTGADYVREKNVTHIDLLKVDVEGHELQVLKGFGDFLKPENVAFIQFEYGGTTKDAGKSLRELYDLLTSRGYEIGRLLRDAVEIRSYDPRMEDYRYANYIALASKK